MSVPGQGGTDRAVTLPPFFSCAGLSGTRWSGLVQAPARLRLFGTSCGATELLVLVIRVKPERCEFNGVNGSVLSPV